MTMKLTIYTVFPISLIRAHSIKNFHWPNAGVIQAVSLDSMQPT